MLLLLLPLPLLSDYYVASTDAAAAAAATATVAVTVATTACTAETIDATHEKSDDVDET